jgi:mercuric ion transport protein
MIREQARTPAVRDEAAIGRTQKLVAAGGVLGAFAASSCCIAPLALFSLGISGAWIGNLTALAPYQPYSRQPGAWFESFGFPAPSRARDEKNSFKK